MFAGLKKTPFKCSSTIQIDVQEHLSPLNLDKPNKVFELLEVKLIQATLIPVLCVSSNPTRHRQRGNLRPGKNQANKQ